MIALSILDLVRVTEDTDGRGALDNARDSGPCQSLRLSPDLGSGASQHARDCKGCNVGGLVISRQERKPSAPAPAAICFQPCSLRHRCGTRGLSQPPIDDIETYWSPAEKAPAMGMLVRSIVGAPYTVRSGILGAHHGSRGRRAYGRVRCLRPCYAAALPWLIAGAARTVA
jgi:hypothetical protein